VLLVGGSEVAGVRAAAERLAARVRDHGPGFGYINEVRPGQWADAGSLDLVRYLGPDDAVWERVGQSGSWDYMDNIAKCGTGYLRTGDERYLERFQRELHHFIAHDVFHPNPEARPMLHGRMYVLLMVWDLICDHPRFTAAERRRVDAMFLHVAESDEGTAQIAEISATRAVRYNHHTRSGLDAFFVGRFFARRYGLPEAQAWLATAERLFAPQLASAKPACDSWGHQWAASLFNTLVYALATQRTDYLAAPAFRQAADRALIAYGRGAPRHYLSACAVATGDTGYLSLEESLPALARDAAKLRLLPAAKTGLVNFTDEVLRTFTGNAPSVAAWICWVRRRLRSTRCGMRPSRPRSTIPTAYFWPTCRWRRALTKSPCAMAGGRMIFTFCSMASRAGIMPIRMRTAWSGCGKRESIGFCPAPATRTPWDRAGRTVSTWRSMAVAPGGFRVTPGCCIAAPPADFPSSERGSSLRMKPPGNGTSCASVATGRWCWTA
jgi:hypothetical protein